MTGSRAEAVKRLRGLLEKLSVLKFGEGAQLDLLRRQAEMTVRVLFGRESPYLEQLQEIMYVPQHAGATEERKKARWTSGTIQLRNVLTTAVEEAELDVSPPVQPSDFWPLLHPLVIGVARKRFESAAFADAAEAALKAVNVRVKEHYLKKANVELDGVKLMRAAVTREFIALGDPTTISGKDEQEGYQHIFAGSMQAVRNPKAHGFVDVTPERTIHFLFLASLLMFKLDEGGVH